MAHERVILFMAHYLSDEIVKEFRSLRESCSSSFDVKMLYDNSRRDFDPSNFDEESQYHLYDWDELTANYPFLRRGPQSIHPGNCIFPILLAARASGAFEHVWRVEYDVRFSGNWITLFDYFASNESDLLGTTIFRYDFRPDWNWWKSLKSPDAPVEKKSFLRGFFPVLRLSRKSCAILEAAYNAGWRGHYEVTIPTILSFKGCSIEDIGGDGEFVKPVNVNRFYTNTPSAPGLAPGTFVCPPHSCNDRNIPNKLYHPIKE